MRRTLAPMVALVAIVAVVLGCGGGKSKSTTPIQVVQIGRSAQFNASAIYVRDAPGVVTVISEFGQPTLGGLLRGGAAQGSGFVISKSGEVATNAHVVTNTGGNLQRASAVYVRFADGNEVPAKIVGTDTNEDVALLRVDPSGLKLTPLALGSSSKLVVGAPVAAIGSPFGERGSLSVGVISGINRVIRSLNGTGARSFAIPGAIQTDAAINHGNSGGPLVDAGGAVIGINAQLESGTTSNTGVGFAVPIDAVKRSLAQLRSHGSVSYGYLGITSTPLFPQLAKRLGLKVTQGALIDQVNAGSPAAQAGLRGGSGRLSFDAQRYPSGGDVITKLNGRSLDQGFDLISAVAELGPGQKVTLEVWSGGSHRNVTLTLGTRPNRAGG